MCDENSSWTSGIEGASLVEDEAGGNFYKHYTFVTATMAMWSIELRLRETDSVTS